MAGLTFDEVMWEYAKRGDAEVLADFDGVSQSERDDWASECAACVVCGDISLHDDELYHGTDGVALCGGHSVYCEDAEYYVKSA